MERRQGSEKEWTSEGDQKGNGLGGCDRVWETELTEERGNPEKWIFLGKNYLGQKDYFESDNKDALAKLDQILDGVKENAVKETE